MRKYFVWTRDIERVIYETLSGKRKRLTLDSDATIKLLRQGS